MGALFSLKAAIPSRASAESRAFMWWSRAVSISFCTGLDERSSIKRFVWITAVGAPDKNLVREFLRLRHDGGCRNDTIDQPDLQRPLRIDDLATEEELANVAFPDLAAKKGHHQRWNESALHFRVANFRPLGRNDIIAGRHDSRAAGDRSTMNRGNRNQPRLAQGGQHFRHHFGGGMSVLRIGRFEIQAGTEAAPAPRIMRMRSEASSDAILSAEINSFINSTVSALRRSGRLRVRMLTFEL